MDLRFQRLRIPEIRDFTCLKATWRISILEEFEGFITEIEGHREQESRVSARKSN